MRRIWSRLAGVLAAAAVSLAASQAVAKPAIWVVRSAHATITLFGSIHLLPPGLDWRPAALDDALAQADELWFELPIDTASDNEAANVAIARGALPKNKRLTALMSADDVARLRAAAAAVGCVAPALDRMQPWMADLTLSVAADARTGADASDGVERQVQAITAPSVARRAFETPKQQIGFLAGAPMDDQLASLRWTLTEIETDPDAYQRAVNEWMAGNVGALERDAVDQVRHISPRYYERLIGARNRRWTDVLARRLQQPGHIVVIVGAGHLVGAGGVPALLRARGFAVDGP